MHYAGLTDEDLQAAYRHGPGGYRGDVWGIVESEYTRRFGPAGPASPQVVPEGGSVAPDQTPAKAIKANPWFLFARLRGKRWPAELPLPTTYLRFLGGMAGVWTLINLLALVAGVVDYLGYHPNEGERLPLLEAASVAWSILIFVAAASKRPWAWYYLIWALVLASLYTVLAVPIWSLVWLLAALYPYPLVWLYLARRRNQFGLSPWRSVM
jgi:hypothetical protein